MGICAANMRRASPKTREKNRYFKLGARADVTPKRGQAGTGTPFCVSGRMSGGRSSACDTSRVPPTKTGRASRRGGSSRRRAKARRQVETRAFL